jgi:hypothetical protein
MDEANRVRLFVLQEVKPRLLRGELTFREVLDVPEVAGFQLRVVLGWLERVGKTKTLELVRAADVQDARLTRPVRNLTVRERDSLAEAVDAFQRRRAARRRKAERDGRW